MPIIHSGTFSLSVSSLLSINGNWQANTPSAGNEKLAGTGQSGTLTAYFGNTASAVISLSGIGVIFLDALPAGFQATTGVSLAPFSGGAPSLIGASTMDIAFGALASVHCDSMTSAFVLPIPDNAMAPGAVDLIAICTIDGDMATFDSSAIFADGGMVLTGSYTIEAFWWLLPEDPCKTVASKLVLVAADGASPGDGYVKQDVSFVPTVTIDSIVPALGPITGGTALTIKGSGFGNGATIDIGGSAATSVVIVDQFTITCVSPAHAVGAASVTVTNPTTV
jgi:IPT/TIG domain-containing protein